MGMSRLKLLWIFSSLILIGSSGVVCVAQTVPQFLEARVSAAGASPSVGAAGDLNNDGKLDLVVPNLGGRNLSVLLGNRGGTFEPPRNFDAGAAPFSVALGDFNHDGNPDVA